ncbi:hypothetical protein GCN74_17220 [Janthinobacterium sp. FT14W]|nr:hypothetical protein GCN74_17220 [Janthinobacterium sp. FT14W]
MQTSSCAPASGRNDLYCLFHLYDINRLYGLYNLYRINRLYDLYRLFFQSLNSCYKDQMTLCI